MGNEAWRKAWVSNIAKRVKDLRKEKGLKGDDLSERTKELGYEIPRSTLANIETGRKSAVGIHEIAILAAALEVPPVSLLFDVGSEELVEVLPDDRRAPIEAVQWFSAIHPLMPKPGLIKSKSFNPSSSFNTTEEYQRAAEDPEMLKISAARSFEALMVGYALNTEVIMELHMALDDLARGITPVQSLLDPNLASAGREDYLAMISNHEEQARRYLKAIRDALPEGLQTGVKLPFMDVEIRRDVYDDEVLSEDGEDNGTAKA
ncbi:helix-turn-helix domain-containing protein [Brevibacterium casei]|uniref:helix-turn-helix domain-containing protein n=1 Tax=Brevibacterium casei TaxID=33889 RepID=UPI0028AB07C2|nr:helix-turn-helix transcriptional regulator [Brevibacterium casei]